MCPRDAKQLMLRIWKAAFSKFVFERRCFSNVVYWQSHYLATSVFEIQAHLDRLRCYADMKRRNEGKNDRRKKRSKERNKWRANKRKKKRTNQRTEERTSEGSPQLAKRTQNKRTNERTNNENRTTNEEKERKAKKKQAKILKSKWNLKKITFQSLNFVDYLRIT